METKDLYLIGYAAGMGAKDTGCAAGPKVLSQSRYLTDLHKQGINIYWQASVGLENFIYQSLVENSKVDCAKDKLISVHQCDLRLAQEVRKVAGQQKFFVVIGGDHSCAIGTWTGAYHALKPKQNLGLIWIDAHMDAHTFQTTPTGNIHGMSIASLLGFGSPMLSHLLSDRAILRPEHLCLIGIRSYEEAEAALLRHKKVKIFFMDEVRRRGMDTIIREAIDIVSHGTERYGVSIDIDSLDPTEAPATGYYLPHGLSAQELFTAVDVVSRDPKLIGAEIVEFDPGKDQNNKTEALIAHVLYLLAQK